MAQRILGIDIGSYSIKISELTRSLREFELTGYFEQIISASSRLTHEEATAAALRSVVEKHGMTDADLISVNLPGHQVSCRILSLPFGNLKKIDQTIDFELEGQLPVNIEDLLIDYSVLNVGENHSTVLAAYLPRARFMKYLDMLQVAGVDPKYMGVDAIDLSNIAQVALVPPESSYAILDIGHQKTNLTVMKGDRLQYVRSLTLGGLHFTRAIQKTFRLNFERAEALKMDRGRVGLEEGKDQISRLCQKVAEDLVVAIRQTYLGYRQIHKEDWTALFLTGGGSRLNGLGDFLSSSLRLNVGSLDCLDFIPHKLPQPELHKDLIAPSLSQTLRVIFSNKAIKINFRTGAFAYQRDIKALGSEIKQLGVWLSVVFILAILHFSIAYYGLNKKISGSQKGVGERVAQIAPEFKVMKSKTTKQILGILDGKITEIEAQLEALAAGSSHQTVLDYFLEVSKKIPSREDMALDVDDLSYTGNNIRIEGRTNSFEAVDKIKAALESSSLFKEVNTQNVSKGIRDEIKFSLSIDIGES